MTGQKAFAKAIFVLVALGCVGSARIARAADLSVEADGCGDLRVSEVKRILRIELLNVSSATREDAPLRVELSCDEDRVRVVAIDPVTDKRLSRDVVLGRARDRERTLALLVSQLFLTSWAELLLAPPKVDTPVHAAPPPAAAVSAAQDLTKQALPSQSPRWRALLAFGPRVRDLHSSPTVTQHVALDVGLALSPRARALVQVGYERGSADRVSGTVDLGLASASVGASLALVERGRFVLETGATAGATYIDVRGNASAPAVASAASGVAAQGALHIMPAVHLGPVLAGLAFEAGLTAPRVDAHVARDADVSLGGAWGGASLIVGLSPTGAP
jgi:hypothetical protein